MGLVQGKRFTQLDGWRAVAVLGVMWLHFVPREFRGAFPFEIGLYYFLTLTGFLITRVLLRMRDDAGRGRGFGAMYREFMGRRFARILLPCYAAMVFAICVGASDIRAHPWMYFLHVVNFHIAYMDGWPSGTAHYWTLAIQMQFYALWPLLVLKCPRRWLGVAFGGFALLAPVSRWFFAMWHPEVIHAQAMTPCAMDYFAVGALLAWLLHGGMSVGDKRFGRVAMVCFAIYAVLYTAGELGRNLGYLDYVKQTLLSVAMAGLISRTMLGYEGVLGRFLDARATQHIAKVSYGLYLLHTPVPLLLGRYLPWVFREPFVGGLVWIRWLVFFVVSWGLAWLSWRWLENPRMKRKC